MMKQTCFVMFKWYHFILTIGWINWIINPINCGQYGSNMSPATIVKEPMPTTVQAGDFIIMICKAQGNPKPEVFFKINGKKQESLSHGKIVRTFEYGASIRMRVQMDDNGATVECIAHNHLGTDQKQARITVIDSNSQTPAGFPEIITEPGDILSAVKKKVTLKCEVKADPPAIVTWIKNSNIPVEIDPNKYEIIGTGSLLIKSITEEDNGNYECMARNKVGLVISRSASVQIRNSPRVPQFIKMPTQIEVSVGQGTNLTCNAEGYPIPHVWWAVSLSDVKKSDGTKSIETRDLTKRKPPPTTIIITDITESALYICFARNDLGTTRHKVQIVVKKKPRVPSSVTTRQIGSTFAIIEWLPLTTRPFVDSYTLLLKDRSNQGDEHLKNRQIANIFPSALGMDKITNKVYFNVTELKPYTEYEAKVFAVNNKIGKSDPSTPTYFKTTELPPSTAPRDVQAKATAEDAVQVKWRSPLQTNGRITGYKIFHSRNKDSALSTWTVFKTDDTKYYLTNLIRNATYYVKVNAFNNAGDGPISDAFPILVYPGVPPVPQNFRAAALKSYSIQIMWSTPVLPAGMILKSYVLKYKPHNDPKAQLKIETLKPNKTQHLIDGLKPGTVYHISLAGKTAQGEGIAAQVTEKTSDEIPDKPRGISLEVLSSNSIKVTWEGPLKMRSQIKHYIIKWRSRRQINDRYNDDEERNSPDEGTIQVDADPNQPDRRYEQVLNNLPANLYYKIEVSAVSSRGKSKPYEFEVTKTTGQMPSQPTKFEISQVRPIYLENELIYANVHLVWGLPERTHGKILGYRVCITLIGPKSITNELGEIKIYRNVSSFEYSTSKNDKIGFGRRYLFEVEALNEVTYGFPNHINVTIQEKKPRSHPEKIEIKASKTIVIISWQPPMIEYRNGIILGYKIKYYKMKDKKSTETVRVVKGHTSVKIKNLDEDSTYVFMLCAFNSKGDGPWSPGSPYYISMDYFPPPENIEARALSDSEIKVTWDYPDKSRFTTNLDSQIVGFSIYIAHNDAPPSTNQLYNDARGYYKYGSGLDLINGHSIPATISRIKPMTLAVLRNKLPNTYFIRVRCVLRDERVSEWSAPTKVSVYKSLYPELEITKFSCNGKQKAIHVIWNNPKVDKDIYKYEILIVGIRKYRDFDGEIKKEMLSSHSEPIFNNKSNWHNYLINNMKSNTIYDVTITTKFNSTGKVRMLNKTTSCVTYMSSPSKVNYPQAIPQKKKTDEVILRLYRTEEKQGVISHYYLIVGPIADTHITPSDVSINETFMKTTRIKTQIKTRYVVAQFTQAFFNNAEYSDIVLGASIANERFNQEDWIYLKNPKLDKGIKYRAFLRACVLPEGTMKGNANLACTSSEWSKVFSTEINKEMNVFTIALVSVIVIVVILILACIGLASFLRRTHDKVNRPMNNNDPYLKQPLMMQQSIGGANQNPALNNSTLPSNQNGGTSLIQVSSSSQPYTTIITSDNNSNHNLQSRHNVSLTTTGTVANQMLQNGGSGVATTMMIGGNNSGCNTIGSNNPYQSPGGSKTMMMQHRSLELKQGVQAPDLVQNALSIGTSQRPPISIHRLENHINELRSNENFLFSQEYECIDPGQQFTWEHSNMEINRSKNRYANVIAYDHSRVVLQSINGVPGSDYINANYIDGYKRSNAYIATQGPLSNTFGDFWRMVWEQETDAIVMMTRLEERTRVKCDQYWPNKSTTESYADGTITVTLTEIAELAYYTVRTFILTSNYVTNLSEASLGSNRREVKQYQFTAWPDHGVPDNPIPLLMFINRVRASTMHNCGPLIVHCSAGVGRTGAYIAIDASLERLRHEMSLDIFGQVSLMRAQRNYMVQTEEQYVFVHEVLLDSVRAGHTEISAQQLPAHVQAQLRGGTTGTMGGPRILSIEMEFQKLAQLKSTNNNRCTSANLPINKLKNRLVNILPYEHNRVCLQPIRGCDGSDYINASFIDGYYATKAYIATQAPLLETVEDFWRMIWEMNSTIIVMLTKLKEMGREKCHRYWPSERSSRYQYFVVDPMVEYNMPNFVLQEFKVTDARDGQSRTIRQFQFTEWPEQGVPFQSGGEPFIDFIGQVHKTKEQFGQEGPITVHCSAGVGRTGVFLALSISLEKLRKEGVVNLFQTVRMLRHQRANMIQTEEQYKFCYLALQDYVTSFDNVLE